MNGDLKPGRYRHFKGNEYELLFVATHSETLEPMVVYRALYGERGDFEKARGYLQQALELKTRALGHEHVDVGISWVNLGTALATERLDAQAHHAFGQFRAPRSDQSGNPHHFARAQRQGVAVVMSASLHGEALDIIVRFCGIEGLAHHRKGFR